MTKIWLVLDRVLATLGAKKTQKGFLVTAISALLLQVFPDFPQEAFTRMAELLVELFTILGAIWTTFGVIHQWVKDRILVAGFIPPSVEVQAAATGKPVLVEPPKKA